MAKNRNSARSVSSYIMVVITFAVASFACAMYFQHIVKAEAVPDLTPSTNAASPTIVPWGGVVTYTYTLINAGSANASAMDVFSEIESGSSNPTNFTFNNCGGAVSNSSSASYVELSNVATMMAQNCIITFDVTLDDPYSGPANLNNDYYISPAVEGGPEVGPRRATVNPIIPACGDGNLDPGEDCDDGNLINGDGCSATCEVESTPECGDGNLDPGEDCDDGNLINGDGCSNQCEFEQVVIEAYKVMCLEESDLPNWGATGASKITANTAIAYVDDSDGRCWLENGWSFEWNLNKKVLNGDYTGEAPDSQGWLSFDDPSTVSGPAKVVLSPEEINNDSELWFREVLQSGFVPFTAPPKGLKEDNVTAEFYCDVDAIHYDNLEWIRNMEAGNTYYCVAFNAPLVVPECGDGNLDPGEDCDDGNLINGDGCSATCKLEPCGECDGKISQLTLRYNGVTATQIKAVQKNGETVYSALVQPNGEFTVIGTDNGTFNNELKLYIGNVENTSFHTSCSQEILINMNFGDFTVMGGASKDGGRICSGVNRPCKECDGKMTNLTLRFNSLNSAQVSIEQKKGHDILFNGLVQPGEEFSFIGTDKGTMGTEIIIDVNGHEDVKIHTSCSHDIYAGMTFGSFTIIEGASKKGGPICPMEPICPIEPIVIEWDDIPCWAEDAVAWVIQNELFSILDAEDVRDAVKFHRIYLLLQQ